MLTVGSAPASAWSFGSSGPGSFSKREAEEVLDLAGQDDHGDARRESDGDRVGNVFDEGAKPQQPGRQQDQPRQQRCKQQPVDAVLRHRRRDQHDEGARRPADLEAAAAECGDDEAADDRRCTGPCRASRPRRWRSPWTAAARRWRPSGRRWRRPAASRRPYPSFITVTSLGVKSSAKLGLVVVAVMTTLSACHNFGRDRRPFRVGAAPV